MHGETKFVYVYVSLTDKSTGSVW